MYKRNKPNLNLTSNTYDIGLSLSLASHKTIERVRERERKQSSSDLAEAKYRESSVGPLLLADSLTLTVQYHSLAREGDLLGHVVFCDCDEGELLGGRGSIAICIALDVAVRTFRTITIVIVFFGCLSLMVFFAYRSKHSTT